MTESAQVSGRTSTVRTLVPVANDEDLIVKCRKLDVAVALLEDGVKGANLILACIPGNVMSAMTTAAMDPIG
jgi:hypothetical protein